MAFDVISSGETYQKRLVYQEGDEEIASRSYNLIFGGTLAWGFLMNVLLVNFCSAPMIRMVSGNGSIALLIGYFVLVLAGSFLLRHPSPVMEFLGFNLIAVPVGLLLSIFLHGIDGGTVFHAVVLTLIVTVSMMIASTLKPDLFLSMGRGLGIALLCSLIASAVGCIFWGTATLAMDWIVLVIMSLYIGYDWTRASVCIKTTRNAIGMAASLYLDLINVFIRLVSILSKSRSRN